MKFLFNKVENKCIIPVPCGLRFISHWSKQEDGYSLLHPEFSKPHILDKKIPGCGYTEYCLTSDFPVILCSPRRILLENKEQQHKDDVFYFKNMMETECGVDKDMTKVGRRSPNKKVTVDKALIEEKLAHLDKQLRDYVYSSTKPPKILVTYDSFGIVKRILQDMGLFNDFYVVVDEMQVVFTDSRFKSSTEINFIEQLIDVKRVCFVSATPMIDKYLKKLDYFKDLPYYEFDWSSEEPTRIIKPDLKVRSTDSIVSTVLEIIKEYKEHKFATLFDSTTGKWIKSTEAVFYVNSINNETQIISKAGLRPEEVNILCSNTPENAKKIKNSLGKEFSIGHIPLKGEPHKMFTICTRTVYLGADFYSTCARTFILSDANIDSLAVDISLDLPQILGRQRLTENPWKNHAEFYYKTIGRGNKFTETDFKKFVDEKIKATEDLLSAYSTAINDSVRKTLTREYEKLAKAYNYRDHYVAINHSTGLPCLNELVLIAEQRAFDIQQIDYANRFSVFNAIRTSGNVRVDKSWEFITLILRDTRIDFPERLKRLCETPEFSDEEKKSIAIQAGELFDLYYNGLGPERCKALGYNTTRMKKEVSDRTVTNVDKEIMEIFKVGSRYTNSWTKETLAKLYTKHGYKNMTAKATDLKKIFAVKTLKVTTGEGKRENGFEILGVL